MDDREFECRHDLAQARERMADYTKTIGEQSAEIERLRKDAERHAARRKAVFLARQRLQVSGPRQTEAEFNAEYDDGCDKNLAGYVTDHRGVWVQDEAMTLTPN